MTIGCRLALERRAILSGVVLAASDPYQNDNNDSEQLPHLKGLPIEGYLVSPRLVLCQGSGHLGLAQA